MAEDRQQPTRCPICELPREEGEEVCHECGYVFAAGKEGAGPPEFASPTVEDVYQPGGKTTSKAILMMLAFGIPGGLAGGPLAYLVIIIAAIFGARIARSGVWIAGLAAQVIAIGAWIVAPMISGGIISILVDKAAKIGRSRNPNARTVFGAICGVIAFGTFLAVYDYSLGTAAYDTIPDFVKLGWVLVAMIAFSAVGGKVDHSPAGTRFA